MRDSALHEAIELGREMGHERWGEKQGTQTQEMRQETGHTSPRDGARGEGARGQVRRQGTRARESQMGREGHVNTRDEASDGA